MRALELLDSNRARCTRLPLWLCQVHQCLQSSRTSSVSTPSTARRHATTRTLIYSALPVTGKRESERKRFCVAVRIAYWSSGCKTLTR
ncbi:hypothetical protein CBOM_07453 [Ceraceosorus bombacis]|uniref:Uncharacterized protein n=1 Tax=Ceraceosorus bombacis TaxID=401625 RepID=A0A0P1B9C9_9BASI|nr:hypothetical protein CBOM_07453 [Ceraceosorus bombacis]